MRRLLVIAALGLGLAAPAGARAAGGPVPPVQGGAGASAPGSDVGYVAVAAGRWTMIERVRRGTGAVERMGRLKGAYGVPGAAYDGSSTGLSADGRTLVLASLFGAYPGERTRLAVIDARRLRPRARIDLRGAFTVDAISPDGRWLYLIHYKSRNDPLSYEVRAYDLRRRWMLAEPVVDPREPDEKMTGLPVTRVVSPDGRWAYTLYQRPEAAPFVHALDTQRRTAACIDVPSIRGGDQATLRLALRGRTLRIDGNLGPEALIDTRTFAVHRPKPAAPPPARRSAPSDGGGDSLPWALAAIPLAAGAFYLLRRRHMRLAQ